MPKQGHPLKILVAKSGQPPAGYNPAVQAAGQSIVDQRLTSFLERYVIERCGKWPEGDELKRGWEVIQDGKSIYKMIQLNGKVEP
jgi:hypothetical protein